MAPVLSQMAADVFGSRLGPLLLEDLRSQLEIPVDQEVSMARDGQESPVHPTDNHEPHVIALQQALQETGDPSGAIRAQMMKRRLALVSATMPSDGGQGQGPGNPGTPRPGSSPKPPQGPKQMAGAIHPDQMRDPTMMPRR